ncbi:MULTISPECIES: ABC transporter permease [Nocardioides]|uniref:ABC transporter permease n=1 Tax=Nocardioides kribbensis TaxID=305517 RepID=A0ABV1P1K2_9ACTN|nr:MULTISPECIES: ABC transporter permease [Nocardioides]KQP64125.1 hypothetical protein ASF47_08775 [Nocardioides sp. Leaf285]
MSATSAPLPTLDVSQTPAVPFGRLVSVELRKSFDTRAGRAYSLSVVGLCVVVMLVIALLFDEGFQDFSDFLLAMGGTLGFFLPIIPILLVTGEFGQRTGLVTFTLEPRRPRIVAAKLSAGLIISLGVLVLAAVIAAVGAVLASLRGFEVSWSLEYSQVQNFVLANLIGVLIGFALAMLLMNTPAAIVGYFVYSLIIPTVVGIIGAFVGWFQDLTPWIELNTAQTPLFTGDFRPSGEEWAQLATASIIWLVVPLTFGILRLLRAEMK